MAMRCGNRTPNALNQPSMMNRSGAISSILDVTVSLPSVLSMTEVIFHRDLSGVVKGNLGCAPSPEVKGIRCIPQNGSPLRRTVRTKVGMISKSQGNVY